MEDLDIVIVGAGIAGTTLALELHQRGAKIAIIDLYNSHSSSRVAAGMMNPMVPRNVQKTWHCDDLYPQIFEYYGHWEALFGARFIHKLPTLQVHKNESHTKNWTKRSRENGFTQHLTPIKPEGTDENGSMGNHQNHSISNEFGVPLPYGAALTHLSGKLDVSVFLECAKAYLISKGISWINESFNYDKILFSQDSNQNPHIYKAMDSTQLKFKKLVFAQGIGLFENPWFSFLPLNATGGDLITLEFKTLPESYILKRKEWLVPIGGNRWIGGSTYHKNSTSIIPQVEDLNSLLNTFSEWIPEKPKVIGHIRAARPTVETWRPFLGEHPQQNGLYVYNGLGSKGSSLVVMLSPMYADFLLGKGDLMSDVDITRFNHSRPGI
jgi:glycine/D-amino acid oxidase-like deaminating enzyme